jgi:hypothetical protein
MLGELVAFAFGLRRQLKERRGSANPSRIRIDVKYAVWGRRPCRPRVRRRAGPRICDRASINSEDSIPAVLWGVGLSGAISSPSLGQGLGARPLWIGLSLLLAFALGTAGGLPAIV